MGLRRTAVYVDEADLELGASFVHRSTGHELRVLRSQSVPQAFLWVHTVPDSDRGEAHVQEHLLLAKGRRGQALAMLNQLNLVDDTAYTELLRTCYHLNTEAGLDTFWQVLEAHLEALSAPDYTDEEVRREAYHLGVTRDHEGRRQLEEKGTVYSEMASAAQEPWGWSGPRSDACCVNDRSLNPSSDMLGSMSVRQSTPARD